jgi:alkylation response protein AidB-like acyl-CoA dehydrogenase
MTVTGLPVLPYAEVSRLDRALGDPADPAARYGHREALHRDRMGAPADVPVEVDRALRLSYLPRSSGGELRALDETLLLAMVAARRDATLMPATMFSVTAATAVLIGGSAEQRDRLVRVLRDGGAVGLAFSEPDTDADPLAGVCRLDESDVDGRVLRGVKWRVGKAPWLLVVARTGERGPGAFTAALLAGDDPGVVWTEEETDGFRGVRFSAVRFDGVRVGEPAVVGGVGRGLELTLRAMQLVRVLSTAASLGAADTALRGALDQLSTVDQSGVARRDRLLGVAAAALFAGQASALAAARAMHVLPGSQAVWSSTVKRVVTELADLVHRQVGDALGFHSVPRSPVTLAARDGRVVRHIDTDPAANLELLAQQLGRHATRSTEDTGVPAGIRDVFDLDVELPEFEPSRLVLTAPTLSPVLDALPTVVAECLPAVEPELGERLDQLFVADRELRAELRRGLADRAGFRELLADLAERFAYLHAAAEAVCLWWANPGRALFGTPPGSARWLSPVLALLLDLAAGGRGRLAAADADTAREIATHLHREGLLFAPPAVPLAESERTCHDQG